MILPLTFSFLKKKDISRIIILKTIILCSKVTTFIKNIIILKKNDFDNVRILMKLKSNDIKIYTK